MLTAEGQTMTNLLATPTQQDVFKSISHNVGGQQSDPRLFYVVAAMTAAFVLLMVIVNAIKRRAAIPRAVNHQGKLLREMLKRLPLRKGEVRQLKLMAAEQGCDSPLTLVLCPSLLAKGMSEKGKADKRVLLGVAKKMGMVKKK
jgi:hypothetical protein